jgi:hypothetical protein
MGDLATFVEKARQCFRLARQCADDQSAEELRQLGRRYAARAVELGADPARVPTSENS